MHRPQKCGGLSAPYCHGCEHTNDLCCALAAEMAKKSARKLVVIRRGECSTQAAGSSDGGLFSSNKRAPLKNALMEMIVTYLREKQKRAKRRDAAA